MADDPPPPSGPRMIGLNALRWSDPLRWLRLGARLALAIVGIVLLLMLLILWGRAALVVFALGIDGMPAFKGSQGAVLNPENLGPIAACLAVGRV